jgi:hypothetical protein
VKQRLEHVVKALEKLENPIDGSGSDLLDGVQSSYLCNRSARRMSGLAPDHCRAARQVKDTFDEIKQGKPRGDISG